MMEPRRPDRRCADHRYGRYSGCRFKRKVRGVGSVSSTSPLYIVDGFQVDNIDYLSNSDIESIEGAQGCLFVPANLRFACGQRGGDGDD